MRCEHPSEMEWVTLKEASKITGRSTHAFRQLINRGRLEKIKKMQENGSVYWLIHRDHLSEMLGEIGVSHEPVSGISKASHEISQASQEGIPGASHETSQGITIPLEFFMQQQKERDGLRDGLMMYRYKFEELERQVRLLPAPPELVAKELEEKDVALQEKAAALAQAEKILEAAKETQQQYQEAVEQLKAKLQEEEYAREAYRIQWESAQAELKLPWWKKLWRKQ